MNEHCLVILVFVFVFLLVPAEIVEEYIKQDVKKRINFLSVGLSVLRELHFLPAECFIYLCDLISIEVYFSHHIFV